MTAAEVGRLQHNLGPAFRAAAGGLLDVVLEELGAELQDIADVVRDRPGYPGWSLVGDLDRTPGVALPWLLQFVGVQYRADLDDATNRARGRERPESSRGTPAHLRAVARDYLTGGHGRIELYERLGGSRRLTLRVYHAELVGGASLPAVDPHGGLINTAGLLEAALNRALPWTLRLTVEVVEGQSYDQLTATGLTYDQLAAKYATYDAMTYSLPGGS